MVGSAILTYMNTNHFPFITTGTTIPAFTDQVNVGNSDFGMNAHFGATFSDVVVRFTVGHRPAGMMVVRIDSDFTVTEVVRVTAPAAPVVRSGARMGRTVRVSDGRGCTESVMA